MDTKATSVAPLAHDEMDIAIFNAMMERGLAQAKAGLGLDIDDAFTVLEHKSSDMRTEDTGSKPTSFPCFPV